MDQRQFIFKKQLLNKAQCKRLIDEYEHRKAEKEGEHCYHAITGVDTESTFSLVHLLHGSETFQIVHEAMKGMISEWMDYLKKLNCVSVNIFADEINYAHIYRLMCYENGGKLHPHIDGHDFVTASCTIQLNNYFNGGQFKFFNGQHTEYLKEGECLIFPAGCFWIHQVTPVTKGKRYSVNTFLCSVPNEKMEKLTRIKNWVKEKEIEPHYFDGDWARKYGSAKINNHYIQTLTKEEVNLLGVKHLKV